MKPQSTSAFGSDDDGETAALWAARLEGGELSISDRQALREWLAQDPAHRWSLARHHHLSAELEIALPALAAAGRIEVPPTRPRARWRSPWFAWSAAAALTMAAAAIWHWRDTASASQFATRSTERQTVKLSDGSRADLNARTRLAIEFRESERRVRLDQGEALFTVAKNPARPFVVETPGGKVRVTGTVFNVRTDVAGRLEVTVLEGTVEVLPQPDAVANEPLRLEVGDQVSLDHQNVSVRRASPEVAAEAAAWRDGRIVFDDVPLGDALERFAAFHGKSITVAPEAAKLRLGGRYALDDLAGFLAGLEAALPVRAVMRKDGSVQVTVR